MIFGYDIKGRAEVARNMKRFSAKVHGSIQGALDASGQSILADAKSRATSAHVKRSLVIAKPSPHIRNLTVEPGEFVSKRWARAKSKTQSGRRSRRKYQPDETVRFYRFLELGTKYHKAKPFLVPSAIKFRATGLDVFNDNFKL